MNIITENIGTVIVVTVLLVAVFFALIHLKKRIKCGKCCGCPHASECHRKKEK